MKEYLNHLDSGKMKKVLAIVTPYYKEEISHDRAQAKLKAEIGSMTPVEVAYIEQEIKELKEGKLSKEEIQGMVEIFKDVMEEAPIELPKGHPIQNYLDENREIEKRLEEVKKLKKEEKFIKNKWLPIYEDLKEIRRHYSRKQMQLYPVLEQKGFDRPSTFMWTLDDYVRDEIGKAYNLLVEDQVEEFLKLQDTIIEDVLDLQSKENEILYPTSLELITAEEFQEMCDGDDEIGYCLIEVDTAFRKKVPKEKVEKPTGEGFEQELQALLNKYKGDEDKFLDVAIGKLTLQQINLIYQHLPVDLSYVDEFDKVGFYSDTKHRVFPRSKNVIGREVKNCHPQESAHIVEEIVEKFRKGEEDEVEFWINKPEVFIYIKYVAVRDAEGNYKGVLEMMQDCSHIRSLEGSQTLLTWSSGKEEIKGNLLENLSGDTKLKPLLDSYPNLAETLIEANSKYKLLKSPLGKVIIPKATLSMVSDRGNMPLEKLIEVIEKACK